MLCNARKKKLRTLIVKEQGLAPVILDSRLEHPAGWICARYKSSVLLLLLLLLGLWALLVDNYIHCVLIMYLGLLDTTQFWYIPRIMIMCSTPLKFVLISCDNPFFLSQIKVCNRFRGMNESWTLHKQGYVSFKRINDR